ncbi:MAG: hypothetical protein ABIR33_11970 [Pyrinomonadaceae bacterium]
MQRLVHGFQFQPEYTLNDASMSTDPKSSPASTSMIGMGPSGEQVEKIQRVSTVFEGIKKKDEEFEVVEGCLG